MVRYEFSAKLIKFFCRDPRDDEFRYLIKCLRRQLAGSPHALKFGFGMNFD